MKKLVIITYLVIFSLIDGCESSSALSPQEAYRYYLNLEEVPRSLHDFKGENTDTFPIFASSAYFTYKADEGYFQLLKKHDKFLEKSELNAQLHEVSCMGSDFPKDFSYWIGTGTQIDTTDKKCFEGVFFPYKHYLIYDSRTLQVNHFMTGIRD